MNKLSAIEKTCKYVQDVLKKNSSCHDWWHIKRVWKLAQEIAIKEQANQYVVELAALLHDIEDWKFCDGSEAVGAEKARHFLNNLSIEEDVTTQVCEIIYSMSFHGAYAKPKLLTLEGKIVQDADRLDAIGAIGIARTFTYGGYKHRSIYEPECEPQPHYTFDQYKNNKGTTINHFYEKLLLLKDRMNTATGKEIAIQKHEFMEKFLEQFFLEWKISINN